MTPLHTNPSFQKAMPSTAGAMREAASAVPVLGLLTVVFALFYAAGFGLHLWVQTSVWDLPGYCALFTAAMAVIVLSARSVLAYGILSLNAVAHETLRACPIPFVAVKPLPHQTAFYAGLAEPASDS